MESFLFFCLSLPLVQAWLLLFVFLIFSSADKVFLSYLHHNIMMLSSSRGKEKRGRNVFDLTLSWIFKWED